MGDFSAQKATESQLEDLRNLRQRRLWNQAPGELLPVGEDAYHQWHDN